MLKVLLVDDEIEILNGMRYIIDWEEKGFEIAALCTNGIEAISVAKREKPHLIITDIRMPEVSGLGLIKELKEVLPETKFVVLSGYDEFEYAKEAISYGVSGYLLKPVDEDELENTLIKIKTLIEKEKLDNFVMKRLKERVRGAEQSVYLSLLNKLINSKSPYLETEEKEIFKEHFEGVNYSLVVIKATKGETPKMHQILPVSLLKNNNVYELNVGRWVVLVIIDSLSNKDLINQLKNRIIEKDRNLLCGISPESCNLLEIHVIYSELVHAVEEEMFFSGSNLLELHNRAPITPDLGDRNNLESMLVRTKSLLKEHLFSIDKNKVNSILLEFSGYISNNRRKIDIPVIRASYISLLSFITNLFADNFDVPLEQLNELSRLIISMNDIKSMNELLLRSKKGVLDVLNYIINQKTENTDELIKYVKCYIQLNYDKKNITLKNLADMYHINPSYLSYLFSKKAGIPFWSYVTNVRIERAKRLLEETNLNIEDVSNRVGFNNEKSFYAVFKKVTGKSPGEFRKAL
jgi:two-component system response regulator YesN